MPGNSIIVCAKGGYKGSGGGKGSSKPMTMKDAARIQSAAAKANGGIVPAGSFAARAQAAAAKNVKDGIVSNMPKQSQTYYDDEMYDAEAYRRKEEDEWYYYDDD